MSAARPVGPPCATTNYTSWKTPWGVTVTVNKAVLRRFKLACRRAKRAKWNPKRIDSYVCREIRESTSMSRHAYACAWDFFYTGPGVPPPGGVWKPTNTFHNKFALCFTDLGFTWGSEWARQDWPHIEWSGSSVPRLTIRERARTFKLFAQRSLDERRARKRGS